MSILYNIAPHATFNAAHVKLISFIYNRRNKGCVSYEDSVWKIREITIEKDRVYSAFFFFELTFLVVSRASGLASFTTLLTVLLGTCSSCCCGRIDWSVRRCNYPSRYAIRPDSIDKIISLLVVLSYNSSFSQCCS